MNNCTCPKVGIAYECPEHGLKATAQKANGQVLSNRKARARLKAKSDKQKIRQAFLDGIRAERMYRTPWCQNCGTTEAKLELHHTIKRSRMGGYREDTYGCDDPSLLTMLCRTCHDKLESHPDFRHTDDVASKVKE